MRKTSVSVRGATGEQLAGDTSVGRGRNHQQVEVDGEVGREQHPAVDLRVQNESVERVSLKT